MAGQAKAGVTLREDLREIVTEIDFSELGLVADTILPPLTVSKRSAAMPVLPREVMMKIPDTARAPHGSFSRGQWEWGAQEYKTAEYGHEEPIDVTEALENEEYVNEEEISSQLAVQGLMLGRESRVATAIFNETTWAGTAITNPSSTYFDAATNCLLTVKNEMDDAANATPFKVFDIAYRDVLRKKNGLPKEMYSLVMSDSLVEYIARSNEVVGTVQYVTPVAAMSKVQRRQFVADYLGFKKIVPISAIYDTAGLAKDAEIGDFWSEEYCLIGILSNGGNTFRERCIGRQPVWTKYSPNYILEDYPEPQKNQRIIRAREYRGITINTDYGLLLKNMKTSG